MDRRTALVTGGSSGIGLAVARTLAADGCDVAVLGRDPERLAAACEALGPGAIPLRADVSVRADIERALQILRGRWPRLDVLVNSAGTGATPRVGLDTPPAEAEAAWDQDIAIHLKGSFLVTLAAAPLLAAPGGRVVMISSIAAFRAGGIAYGAAKAGLVGLTYALARDFGPKGITVNAVAPGFIADTGFSLGWPEERIRNLVGETLVGRPGAPADVAAAVRYLASPEASFVTGEVLHVNGGALFGR
jgi:3-oxoacyl-[acyl-carrier protein] reductase